MAILVMLASVMVWQAVFVLARWAVRLLAPAPRADPEEAVPAGSVWPPVPAPPPGQVIDGGEAGRLTDAGRGRPAVGLGKA